MRSESNFNFIARSFLTKLVLLYINKIKEIFLMDSLTDFNLFYDFFRIGGFGFVKFILRFFCVVDILNAKGANIFN